MTGRQPVEDDPDQRGPLSCAVIMQALPADPIARVERYGPLVVVRHVWPTGPDVIRDVLTASESRALVEYARQVGILRARGYRVSATVRTR